ncbi:hypothetical protein EYM_01825 [Ignicoccus islandicus DSM 13165]|uniref:Uncharacterized protein n=1 Tax=Ignicoccus islandicus DSM 13165 TaxID=940295 RepID=A0A0U2MAK1_9CREN|nr:hypothetical protein [Ignicoccus islandicus]ALU12253.1 hypothetical protein EYM_01825 [Ignicoccus islandicus DSM 13165]
MEKVRVVIGHTLASYCFPNSIVIDPVGLPPLPLRKVEIGDKELPLVPILVERCPPESECVELQVEGVVKEGDAEEKACGNFNCQKPWPLRWLERDKWYLVTRLKVEPKNLRLLNSKLKRIDLEEGKVYLSGLRQLEFEELVWTAPYPVLSKLLNLKEPRRLKATVSIAQGRCNNGIYFHFGKGNPILSFICLNGTVISVAPGAVDGRNALERLVKKGYLKEVSRATSYLIDYYALEDVRVERIEGIELYGRTAQWKEMGLEDVMKCA